MLSWCCDRELSWFIQMDWLAGWLCCLTVRLTGGWLMIVWPIYCAVVLWPKMGAWNLGTWFLKSMASALRTWATMMPSKLSGKLSRNQGQCTMHRYASICAICHVFMFIFSEKLWYHVLFWQSLSQCYANLFVHISFIVVLLGSFASDRETGVENGWFTVGCVCVYACINCVCVQFICSSSCIQLVTCVCSASVLSR